MKYDVGKTVARLRRNRGMSQIELAKALVERGESITNQAVSKWENCVSQPSAGQLFLLSEILEVSDISGEFLGVGVATQLNHEGREKLYEYANLLKLSGLYTI